MMSRVDDTDAHPSALVCAVPDGMNWQDFPLWTAAERYDIPVPTAPTPRPLEKPLDHRTNIDSMKQACSVWNRVGSPLQLCGREPNCHVPQIISKAVKVSSPSLVVPPSWRNFDGSQHGQSNG
eukprot:4816994-Pyramimonas_sp.AAC.1